VLVAAFLMLASVALGRAVVETQAIHASPAQIALVIAGVVAATAVMLAGPVACIAAIAGLTVLRLLPGISPGGGVDLLAPDAFFAALVCWWLLETAGLTSQRSARGMGTRLHGAPILVFLAYVGVTVVYVAAIDPGRLAVSFVSWLRVIETVSLGWLVAVYIRTRRDVTVVLGAIALAGAIAVVLALAGAAGEADAGPLGVRGGGVVNPNTLGLVSGLLVLMGAFGALGQSPLHRVPLALWGVIGLVQSQSVGSLVGTCVALLLGLAFIIPPSERILVGHASRAAVAVAAGVAVAFCVTAAIRPENLPTSQQFRDSSAGQRTVLAAAGLEIVERNPVIGVGWRRSEQPEVSGDPDLNAELRARFPQTRNDFFPDVSPASVHNAYIQVAADLGLIGLALLATVFVSLARDIRRVLERLSPGTRERSQIWFFTWGLVLVAIWWNDNPLFGGQAETVIPAIFVGTIAALGRRSPLAT
jgi:O-antigen ligase